MTSPTSLKTVRVVHHYVGVFFAPTILFFAITGGLQMFGMHETARGSSYVPPDFLVHLSQLHKKGTLYLPSRKPAPPASVQSGGARPDAAKPDAAKPDIPKPEAIKPAPSPQPHNSLPIKIFFAATSIALVLSTCTGLIMSWKYSRRKATILFTLAVGVVIPALLLLV